MGLPVDIETHATPTIPTSRVEGGIVLHGTGQRESHIESHQRLHERPNQRFELLLFLGTAIMSNQSERHLPTGLVDHRWFEHV